MGDGLIFGLIGGRGVELAVNTDRDGDDIDAEQDRDEGSARRAFSGGADHPL